MPPPSNIGTVQPLLTPTHQGALEWFSSHAGQEVGWPAPIEGMFLANKAKGIHKPAGLKYALSIRQSLTGPYQDIVQYQSDGSWQLDYAQEGENPEYFTNVSLNACMKDCVPIGVMLQVRTKPNSRYKVLGLGQVVNWQAGIFEIHTRLPAKRLTATGA